MSKQINKASYEQSIAERRQKLWRGSYSEIKKKASVKGKPITIEEVRNVFNGRAVNPIKKIAILKATDSLIEEKENGEKEIVKISM